MALPRAIDRTRVSVMIDWITLACRIRLNDEESEHWAKLVDTDTSVKQ